MRGVTKFDSVQLSELFVLTADKMRLSPAIIEKDFWVCWMLDYLFGRSPWTRQLAFKGGTSLCVPLSVCVSRCIDSSRDSAGKRSLGGVDACGKSYGQALRGRLVSAAL